MNVDRLHTFTRHKFGPWKKKVLIIVKYLYGLKSSSAMWNHKFSEIIRDMGFKTCLSDFDLWIRGHRDHYE